MRKLDWLLAAVIGTFLVGALMAQAIDWAMAGGVGGPARDGSGQTLLDRVVSVGADTTISRQAPMNFRRP